jgi:hypothetical protein
MKGDIWLPEDHKFIICMPTSFFKIFNIWLNIKMPLSQLDINKKKIMIKR